MKTLADALATKQHLLQVDSFDGQEFVVKAQSALSGRISSMVLEVTMAQLCAWAVEGRPIQEAMPNLTPEEREFLITGIRSDEWDAMLSEDDVV